MFNNLPLKNQLVRHSFWRIRNTQYSIRNTKHIMQNKPNLQNAKMNVSPSITNYYKNLRLYSRCKNKPNQTQYWVCNSPALAVKWQAKNIFSLPAPSEVGCPLADIKNLTVWLKK